MDEEVDAAGALAGLLSELLLEEELLLESLLDDLLLSPEDLLSPPPLFGFDEE